MSATDPAISLTPGRKLGSRYQVVSMLGAGSEGAVYRIVDLPTGIHRAAKLFRPDYDRRGRRSTRHAQKLNRLRRCPIVLQYLHSETVMVRGKKLTALISELCEGVQLQTFIDSRPEGRLPPFMALTLLHTLTTGLAQIHAAGEYHADVHTQNIMVLPRGVGFELKLIDFYEWGRTTKAKQQQDIYDSTLVLYDMLGGRLHYGEAPVEARYICCNRQFKRVLERFPTISSMNNYLKGFEWLQMA